MKVFSDMFWSGLPMQTGLVDRKTGRTYADGILAAEFKCGIGRVVHWVLWGSSRTQNVRGKKVRSREVGKPESLRNLFLNGRSCV